MWYKIPFTYKDFSTGHAIEQRANLLLNLPQVELNEAKNNLFVRDVVRHPVIKSVIEEMSLIWKRRRMYCSLVVKNIM